MNVFDKNELCRFLSFAYRVMEASVPLLEFAIPKSTGELKAYYEKHLGEERGHDLMLLDDLRRLGVTDIPRFHLAAQLAGSQYYLVAHEHPALLLGYMRALESDSPPVEGIDALSAHHGTPLTALRHHALHDPWHKLDLDEVIARHPMQERIVWNERAVKSLLVALDEKIAGDGGAGLAVVTAGSVPLVCAELGGCHGERYGISALIHDGIALGPANLPGLLHAGPEVLDRPVATDVVSLLAAGEMDFGGSDATTQEQKHENISHRDSLSGIQTWPV